MENFWSGQHNFHATIAISLILVFLFIAYGDLDIYMVWHIIFTFFDVTIDESFTNDRMKYFTFHKRFVSAMEIQVKR